MAGSIFSAAAGAVQAAAGAACASMDLDGYWSDTDFNQTLSYICEYLPTP